MPHSSEIEPDAAQDATRRLSRYVGLLAFAVLALVGSSWPLWWSVSEFPRIPFAPGLTGIPFAVDQALVLCLLLGSFASMWLAISQRLTAARGALAVLGISLAALMLLDQHRCQPWAYQFCLVSLILCWTRSADLAVSLLRILVIGLYLHSAVSKFDFSFVDSYGQNFVAELLRLIGVELQLQSVMVRRVLAGLLPLGELLVGLGLLVRRTRRAAIGAGCVMHGLLLVALGPWGLDHRPGVLLWNVFFLVQLVVLFGGERGSLASRDAWRAVRSDAGSIPAALLLAGALVLPLLEPWGYWDHWPAWALYSSRSARVSLYVGDEVRSRLPESLQEACREQLEGAGWWYVDLDRWSLELMNAPIYPQARFRAAVMLALSQRYGIERGVQVELRSDANRWTGHREDSRFQQMSGLREFASRWWLNLAPRGVE